MVSDLEDRDKIQIKHLYHFFKTKNTSSFFIMLIINDKWCLLWWNLNKLKFHHKKQYQRYSNIIQENNGRSKTLIFSLKTAPIWTEIIISIIYNIIKTRTLSWMKDKLKQSFSVLGPFYIPLLINLYLSSSSPTTNTSPGVMMLYVVIYPKNS